MSATDHLKHKQKLTEDVLLFMFSIRKTQEKLYSLNTHSWWRHKLRWSFQMSQAMFTCVVVTPIRYTLCWHLFLCCVTNDQKKHSYSKRELAGFCKWLTNLYHRAVSGPRLRYWWQPVSTYIPRFWINNTDATLFIPFRCRTTLLFSFLSSFFFFFASFSFWSMF
jgi:hypothetical protein